MASGGGERQSDQALEKSQSRNRKVVNATTELKKTHKLEFELSAGLIYLVSCEIEQASLSHSLSHAYAHTHTIAQRERERERDKSGKIYRERETFICLGLGCLFWMCAIG